MNFVKIKIHYFPPFLEFFTFLKNCLPAFKNSRFFLWLKLKQYQAESRRALYKQKI